MGFRIILCDANRLFNTNVRELYTVQINIYDCVELFEIVANDMIEMK